MIESGAQKLLADSGFEPITKWIADNERIKLESLAWNDVSGWIYAFVVNDRVRYIGITTMALRSRMDSYRDLANDRVRSLIRNCLEAGDCVEIYGLRRSGVTPRELEREESAFMEVFRTDWNVRG